jgi:SNF2 family DNA or RNA helicase
MFKELVDEVMDAGLKLVVFSQYVKMITILDDYFTEKGIEHVVLTGSTIKRSECINTFQSNPECRIFLGSLMAGGIGIDLTAASVVIHYDRWWNASKEDQATDRVHRIGQVRSVQVFKFITKGTLEEKIDLMIAQKRNIVDKFIDSDEELFKNLDRRDLIELLQ